ncbi:MAG: hypothetical protein FJ147_17840 [Deltaproteobacteria bacterium]|nr:hypothetical protein [Deltaproteobacteria bacterium]
MATRTIKALGKTGRVTPERAFKAAQEVLRSGSRAKHGQKKILTPEATASGKGLIRFRFATRTTSADVDKRRP